ncbi:MAG: diguanylate cyclase, partial [Mycobacterium sp.]|nr:diguanylate cyclase [Mycobacterium sp.]
MPACGSLSRHLDVPIVDSVIRPEIGGEERHFSGTFVGLLLVLLTRAVGAERSNEVLRRAGETRSPVDLSSGDAWVGYEVYRRICEEAAHALGGCEALRDAELVMEDFPEDDVANEILALGTPDVLNEHIAATSAVVCPLSSRTSARLGDRDWRISQSFVEGREPFPEFCALSVALYRFSVRMFGYPDADVWEEECALNGAPACVFRMRWADIDDATRRASYLETRIRVLEARLDDMQQTVRGLVSGEDLQVVLSQTFAAAEKAMRTPACLLVLDSTPLAVERIYATGLNDTDAEALAVDVLALAHGDHGDRLVAEVCSNRRSYGRLVAIRPTGSFMPHQMATLEAYASSLAAALDAAVTLEDARRQARIAHALLDLATSLAEVTSLEEMAAKLVRAIPGVMDCDRALVAVPGIDRAHVRIAATYGFDPATDQALRERRLSIAPEALDDIKVRRVADEAAGSVVADLMRETGTAQLVTIPVVVDGEWAAAIVAATSKDSSALQDDAETAERLRGLAAQASTAILNAHLLDQVRHQALHDPLTGLPNRALIVDRVERMLSRARREDLIPAAMFIDLDGFKEVNDAFGHAMGDQLLQAVTARLNATMRTSDTVGRLGGDEFIVLIDGSSLDVAPELVAERILAVLHEPFHLDDNSTAISVTASIGIATGDRACCGDLLRDADVALYQAKESGKNRYAIFAPEMQNTIQGRLLLRMDINEAVTSGQFHLVY